MKLRHGPPPPTAVLHVPFDPPRMPGAQSHFESAFLFARRAGWALFEWRGQTFTTRRADGC